MAFISFLIFPMKPHCSGNWSSLPIFSAAFKITFELLKLQLFCQIKWCPSFVMLLLYFNFSPPLWRIEKLLAFQFTFKVPLLKIAAFTCFIWTSFQCFSLFILLQVNDCNKGNCRVFLVRKILKYWLHLSKQEIGHNCKFSLFDYMMSA